MPNNHVPPPNWDNIGNETTENDTSTPGSAYVDDSYNILAGVLAYPTVAKTLRANRGNQLFEEFVGALSVTDSARDVLNTVLDYGIEDIDSRCNYLLDVYDHVVNVEGLSDGDGPSSRMHNADQASGVSNWEKLVNYVRNKHVPTQAACENLLSRFHVRLVCEKTEAAVGIASSLIDPKSSLVTSGNGHDLVDIALTSIFDTPAEVRRWVSVGHTDDHEWRPFPMHCLPDMCRSYIHACGLAAAADTTAGAVGFMTAGFTVIGNSFGVSTGGDFKQPAAMWCSYVQESGSGKSHFMEFLIEPLRRLHEKNRDEYLAKKAEYINWRKNKTQSRRNKAVSVADMQAAVERVQGSHCPALQYTDNASETPATGQPATLLTPIPVPEEEPQADLPDELDVPLFGKLIIDDVTIERAAVDQQNNPKGFLLFNDEHSKFFESLAGGRGKQDDSAKWIGMYNADPLEVARKTRANPDDIFSNEIVVARALMSNCGTIQPEILLKYLTPDNVAKGLAARFVLVSPPNMPYNVREVARDKGQTERMTKVFSLLNNIPVPENTASHDWPCVLLDADAEELRGDENEESKRRAEEARDGYARKIINKEAGMVLRVALWLHCMGWAEAHVDCDLQSLTSTPADWHVTRDTVEKAVEVVRWCTDETLRVCRNIGLKDVVPLGYDNQPVMAKVHKNCSKRAVVGSPEWCENLATWVNEQPGKRTLRQLCRRANLGADEARVLVTSQLANRVYLDDSGLLHAR